MKIGRRRPQIVEPNPQPVRLSINGELVTTSTAPDATLLAVLRERGLTGAKEACGRGECGACTVLIHGEPMLSCITLAVLVTHPVITVEGLGENGRRVRESFAEHCAHQCGYCTPGHVVNATALAARGGEFNREDLRRQVSGNICRCTGYSQILDAVEDAVRLAR